MKSGANIALKWGNLKATSEEATSVKRLEV
jgi:hypothetical protein